MSGDTQISELLQFLRPEASVGTKGPAICYLQGMSVTEEGLMFFRQNSDVVDALCRLIEKDSNATIVAKSYECVLNLSSHEDLARYIVTSHGDFVRASVIAEAVDSSRPNVQRACALLSNLTQSEDNSEKLWASIEGLQANQLLDAFCQTSTRVEGSTSQASSDDLKEKEKKKMTTCCEERERDLNKQDHLAFLFSNLTVLQPVRAWFTDPESRRLERLFPFLTLPTASTTRKHGSVGAIRNCTFDTEHHSWMLKQTDIVSRLLFPLIGPQLEENLDEEDMEQLPIDCQYLGPDKQMERSAEIRKMLIEALNQLCATRLGRQHLKANGVYFVLRELHKVEKELSVVVACENLIDVLIQDEPEQDNLKQIDIPPELVEKFNKMDATAQRDSDN